MLVNFLVGMEILSKVNYELTITNYELKCKKRGSQLRINNYELRIYKKCLVIIIFLFL